mmetsp:Transcript_51081/g.163494  ORF Transcript_51081/g.163494 Transcript_51081/m.163494 type:complete len:380 (+) Transcript_51081:62-1201(+)
MAFRVAQFNILGRHMAGTMWFHYARDFLPAALSTSCPDWTRAAGFPRHLAWQPSEGASRFHRLPVLLAEVRALRADVLCLVELDCFQEFRDALAAEGYDAVFRARPGKADGCGIFWRRDVFEPAAPCELLVYALPAQDRIAAAQALQHRASLQKVLVVSTHLHWDQQAGHQAEEAEELLAFVRSAEAGAGVGRGASVVCGDLNATPGAAAYRALLRRFRDAALQGEAAEYSEDAFTSLKPDVYYFARPRGRQHDAGAADEWHWQEGRHEVLDYVLYDPGAFELERPVAVPSLGSETPPPRKRSRTAGAKKAKAPYGYWAGGWAFEGSPAPGWEERRYDSTWRPGRTHGQLQLGIPNRLHGSDHLPVACTLRLRHAAAEL